MMTADVDAVMEEIRAGRKRVSARVGHDPSRYIDYLKRLNEKYAEQVKRYQARFVGRPEEVAAPD